MTIMSELMRDAWHLVRTLPTGVDSQQVARRLALRVSPKEFDELAWEMQMKTRMYYPPIQRGYTNLRVFGIKVIADPELTEILPILKDYGSSG
jgi:hypothetical protein